MNLPSSPKKEIKSQILNKYLTMSGRFQNAGIGLLAAAVLVHLVSGGTKGALILVLAVPGVICLVFGGSSMQPHNLAKAFAQQLAQMPTREMAEAFLEVLEREKQIGLTKSSVKILQSGIETYAAQEDADPVLAGSLRQAVKEHIKIKAF